MTIHPDLTSELIRSLGDRKHIIQLLVIDKKERLRKGRFRVKHTIHKEITQLSAEKTMHLISTLHEVIPSALIAKSAIQVITSIECLNRTDFLVRDRLKTKIIELGLEVVEQITIKIVFRQKLRIVRHRDDRNQAHDNTLFVAEARNRLTFSCKKRITSKRTKSVRIRTSRILSRGITLNRLNYAIHIDITSEAAKKFGNVQIIIANLAIKTTFYDLLIGIALTHIELKKLLIGIHHTQVRYRNTSRSRINQRTKRKGLRSDTITELSIVNTIHARLIRRKSKSIAFAIFIDQSQPQSSLRNAINILSRRISRKTYKRGATLLRRGHGGSKEIFFPISTMQLIRVGISATFIRRDPNIILKLTIPVIWVIPVITHISVINSFICTRRISGEFKLTILILRRRVKIG